MAKSSGVVLGPRIAIYGPSGSGKTTLARALGEKLGLPVVELDAIFHANPNWVDLEREEFRERVGALLVEHAEGWVIDGNYHSAMQDLVLAQTDTAIWLRLPFRTVYRRLAWRTISRSLVGAELWNGNRESLRQTFLTSDSMLWWGIKSWRPAARKTHEALTTVPHHARVIVLRSPGQVARLIELAERSAKGAELLEDPWAGARRLAGRRRLGGLDGDRRPAWPPPDVLLHPADEQDA